MLHAPTSPVYDRSSYVGRIVDFLDNAAKNSQQKTSRHGVGQSVTTVAIYQNAAGGACEGGKVETTIFPSIGS